MGESITSQIPRHPHIWLVTGPAGCGKSTVAQHLSNSLKLPYVEGDEYHPPANVEKMRNSIPLTDADRWDWLIALRMEAVKRLSDGNHGVVVTCSALKRKYRDVLRVATYFKPEVKVHFIFCDAPEDVLVERVASRQNHYMPPSMVRSQFADLERPTADELDVISVNVSPPIDVVTAEALSRVKMILDEDV